MRIERVVLEDHRDIAVAGPQVADITSTDPDFAIAHFLQTGNHAQQGGFAAAGRADQHDEFTVGNIDADVPDDVDSTKAFLDVSNIHICHVDGPLNAWVSRP